MKRTKIGKVPDFEYRVRIDSMKGRDKVIKRIERIIRSSMEYRDLMFFLKENVDFDQCLFFSGVTNSNGNKSRIEIHHEPFTLYDLVDIVLCKWEETGRPLNELYIAEEIMELHYKNMVGLVPLSKTVHELVHSSYKQGTDKLFIPINLVYGDFKEFIEDYGDYIDDAIYTKYKDRIDKTKELTPDSFKALMKDFEYLDVEGVDKLEKIESDEDKEISEEIVA